MKVSKIVFSPTGGTQRVADIIADNLGEVCSNIDLSEAEFTGCTVDNDCIAVIAVPSFGGRAPKIAIDRLKMIKANGAKAVVAAVYGNREQEDTLIEAADAAKECGFCVIAGISAIAEHSIAHQYAAGRPDKTDEEQLKEFAGQIISKADALSDIPGNRPYKKYSAGFVPKATSACVSCGLCASKCPVGAIDKTNPRKTDKSSCISCMRCAAICPHNARGVNPIMVKAVSAALKKACSKRKDNKLFI